MRSPADDVLDIIFGRWRSQILAAGAELGVFDKLSTEYPRSASALAEELGVDPDLLYRLLRAQAAIGLLSEDQNSAFTLTHQGDLLRGEHP
ncbi:MAG TPA: methyltransferase dimerization domain-containing protein, partial [Hyphomicrobiaceae bacterium]|nr:methyltransferase dimerization domain-containing protein [Hyphomicrobiaceae bacterium]